MQADDNDQKDKKPSVQIGKVIVDRDICIGAAPCVALAPNTFALDSEGKAFVINITSDDPQTILDAAQSCPVMAIKVYDKNGKLIFPT